MPECSLGSVSLSLRSDELGGMGRTEARDSEALSRLPAADLEGLPS